MPRALRSDLPDGTYHITARGVAGAAIFGDDVDRVSFLRLLAEASLRYAWRFHAFCLMTTHYHLVLDAALERLSRGMQWLNGTHARRFNDRHDRSGHLFGSRFALWVVDSDSHLQSACEYVLANPVRAGLCAAAADWPWSASFDDPQSSRASAGRPPLLR